MTFADVMALSGEAAHVLYHGVVLETSSDAYHDHPLEEMLDWLANREGYGNQDVFLEWWGDGEWMVTNRPLVLDFRSWSDTWNICAPTHREALYKACIVHKLGLERGEPWRRNA